MQTVCILTLQGDCSGAWQAGPHMTQGVHPSSWGLTRLPGCRRRALQENLRQLCVFKLANDSSVPWKWWEYVTMFGEQCRMADNQYNEECAERVRARGRACSRCHGSMAGRRALCVRSLARACRLAQICALCVTRACPLRRQAAWACMHLLDLRCC